VKRVFAIVGMPGSGKGEVVRLLSAKGMPVVVMGDLVRASAAEAGKGNDDMNLGKFANDERQEFGMGIWAKRTIQKIKNECIIIDGLRGDAELDEFRRTYGDKLIIMAVHASPEIRFQRLVERARKDAPVTKKEFMDRDAREIACGIRRAMAKADLVVNNEGGLQDLKKELDTSLIVLEKRLPT